MGDTPGDVIVVTEVGKPRNSGEPKPNHIKFRAFHMELVVHVWKFNASVRVAC